MYQILLYYKYTKIENPEELMQSTREICDELGLKGRIIIAKEGINGTLEGTVENTQKYIDWMKSDPRFDGMNWKISEGTGSAFPKLSIKVRDEIVTLGLGENDFSPEDTTGKYLSAEELHEWIHSGKEFYIVDMRNDYEYKVGAFRNSIFPSLKNFRDLPNVLPELEHLKDKTVLTVCTGGVRCEKASGFLVKHGFKDVYQLHNGIVTYMEKYPNEDFLGQLYVFDGRIVMGFNLDDPKREIIGKCEFCGNPTEHFINCANKSCNKHMLVCEECNEKNKGLCKECLV